MDSYKTLRGILNISLFLMAVGWLALFVFLIMVLSGIEIVYPITNLSENISLDSKPSLLIMISFKLILSSGIIYLISIIKKLVNSFRANNIFTNYQITGFKLIGNLIIWITVINATAEFLLKMIIKSRFEIGFDFPNFWLFIALGAFFIMLSQIFQKAKILKEENELTV